MEIQYLLNLSSSRHDHLCPRQVLGVRTGLLAIKHFGLTVAENPKKQLLAILESDGCFADGVEVATGCTIGHRTLRVEDYGKIAATFVDTSTGVAIRITPRLNVRQRAIDCITSEARRYFAQLQAYQILPDEELLSLQEVHLKTSLDKLISKPGVRINCDICGEEIINERQVQDEGLTLCRSCAGNGYYSPMRKPTTSSGLLVSDLFVVESQEP